MRQQSGSMLLDLIFGGAIAMMMLAMFFQVSVQVDQGRQAHREGVKLAAGAAGLQTYLAAQGSSIVTSGTASGFMDPYRPRIDELQAAGYLPQFVTASTPFGGALAFSVRRGVNNDLMGLACDSSNLTQGGKPSELLAAKVMAAAGGAGLRTSAAAPSVLNGAAFQNVTSPVAGAAIVCAWSFIPNPS